MSAFRQNVRSTKASGEVRPGVLKHTKLAVLLLEKIIQRHSENLFVQSK